MVESDAKQARLLRMRELLRKRHVRERKPATKVRIRTVMEKSPFEEPPATETTSGKRRRINAYAENKQRYERMSDEDVERHLRRLMDRIGENVSKVEIRKRNNMLITTANKRGITDKFFPPELPPCVKKISEVIKTKEAEGRLEEVLLLMNTSERELVDAIHAGEYFERKDGIAVKHNLPGDRRHMSILAERTLRVMTGDIKHDQHRKLRAIAGKLGEERMAKLRTSLSEREIAIVDEIALSDRPGSGQELGERFDISREMIRQTGAKLLKKLEALLNEEAGIL